MGAYVSGGRDLRYSRIITSTKVTIQGLWGATYTHCAYVCKCVGFHLLYPLLKFGMRLLDYARMAFPSTALVVVVELFSILRL